MSNTIRCPKCSYYEQTYKAPLGKIVRNPAALLVNNGNGVVDDCNACNGSGYIPTVVLDSIKQAFPSMYDKIVSELRWSMDHYSFMLGEMYVGCELDGYIHS
jgi:hypothetical protein